MNKTTASATLTNTLTTDAIPMNTHTPKHVAIEYGNSTAPTAAPLAPEPEPMSDHAIAAFLAAAGGSDKPPRPATLVEALAQAKASGALSASAIKDASSAINSLARMAHIKPEDLPAAPVDLRPILESIKPAAHDMTKKRYSNIRSALLSVLVAVDLADPPGPRGDARDGLGAIDQDLGKNDRLALERFLRFCQRRGIPHDAVTNKDLEAYRSWLEKRTLKRDVKRIIRNVRRGLNRGIGRLPGLPAERLPTPADPRRYGVKLADMPASFQTEFNDYLEDARHGRGWDDDSRNLSEHTVNERRLILLRSIGIASRDLKLPLDTFSSLEDLVDPAIAKAVVDDHFARADRTMTMQAIHAIREILVIGRDYLKLPEEKWKPIEAQKKKATKKIKNSGISPRTHATVMQFRDPAVVGQVLRLPGKLYNIARKLYATNPVAAARLAEVALMIDLFWLTLLRRRNMAGLHLDRHLCRDRKGAIIGVVIPGDEVKNGMILDIPLGKRIADRIERHISMYRPLISGADDGRWLFPGVGGRPRNGASLTRRVREVIETHCGVRLTPHGFRHLGYMLLAQLDPQATASASHLLGHTSQKTSERAYGGLRTLGAFKSYDRVLAEAGDKPRQAPGRRHRGEADDEPPRHSPGGRGRRGRG